MTDTIPALLDTAAERFGDRVFLSVGKVTRTYRQARTAAAETAGALAARGCRPGDRVAVMARNRIEFVDLILGCAWLGAVLHPPEHRPARGGTPACPVRVGPPIHAGRR